MQPPGKTFSPKRAALLIALLAVAAVAAPKPPVYLGGTVVPQLPEGNAWQLDVALTNLDIHHGGLEARVLAPVAPGVGVFVQYQHSPEGNCLTCTWRQANLGDAGVTARLKTWETGRLDLAVGAGGGKTSVTYTKPHFWEPDEVYMARAEYLRGFGQVSAYYPNDFGRLRLERSFTARAAYVHVASLEAEYREHSDVAVAVETRGSRGALMLEPAVMMAAGWNSVMPAVLFMELGAHVPVGKDRAFTGEWLHLALGLRVAFGGGKE